MSRKLAFFFLLFVVAGVLATGWLFAQTADDPNEGTKLEYDSTNEIWRFKWWGREGRTYFIQHSEDLVLWNWVPVVEAGEDSIREWGLTTTSDKFFMRLRHTDIPTNDPEGADFDGDGMANLFELEEGGDPLDYYNGILPSLVKLSGDGQIGEVSSVLPNPLTVQVSTSGTVPSDNAPVEFSIIGNLGQISTSGTGPFGSTANLRTGTAGTAEVYLQLSGTTGTTHQVQALITSGTASTAVTFSATAHFAPSALSIVSGNSQTGRANEYLESPLTVELRTGTAGTLLIGAPVTYTVTSGTGGLATQFGGTTHSGTLSVVTGSNGRAQAHFRQAEDATSTISVTSGTSVVVFTATRAGGDVWSAWSFNEGYGDTALETTGLGADGIMTNEPEWSEGFDGTGGVEFSGSNSYVTMGEPSERALDLAEDSFTVAFWVRYPEIPGSSETFRIVSKGFDNFGPGYFVGLRGDGKLAAGLGTTSGTAANAILFKTTGTFNDGEWHAVAAVYDRTNATAQIYVDGTAQNIEKEAGTGGTVTSGTLSLAGLSSLNASGTGSPFTVSSFSGTSQFFQGEVDQVEIHKLALAGSAIEAIHNADLDGNELPDWWEYKYFQYVGIDPDDDDDRDGLTNAEEYGEDSDPRDYYDRGETTIIPVVTLISGNGQSSGPDQFLADPLTVEVMSGTTALINAPVIFTVTSGSGAVASQLNGAAADTRTVYTGSNGQAVAWYRQSSEVNVTSTISAQAGASNPVNFEASTLGINSLVGHWKFDEGTGTTATDSAPFVHTGTLINGPTWQERYSGESSLSFSGSGAHVVTASGTTGMLDFANDDISVTAWIKTGTSAPAGRIISKGNENANAGYYLAINAQGEIESGLGTTQSGTSAETIHIKTTGSFNDDAWHAVAAVYDRRNSTAKIYVDGTIRTIAKETGSGGTINVTDSTSLSYPDLENLSGSRNDVPLTIASQSGTSAFFQGGIDETRVYRKALSAQEVLDLYHEEGELSAVAGELTVLEDALGEITLESWGGGDSEPVYTIVTSSANGALVLSGSTVFYRPNLDFSGTDGFRFRVTKGTNSAEADVVITVTPFNDPPFVSVGGGRSITMSGTTASVVLSATVTDADTAPENVSLTWSKVSGSGEVLFSGTNPLAITATFDEPGDYTLRLSANDGFLTRSDSLIVSVNGSSVGTLPTVSLVYPEDEASYENGQTVTLKAATSVGSGLTVTKVEFFEGSRKLGEATTPAISGYYELAWTPSIEGHYRVSAKVTDSDGAKVFSDSIVVSLTPLPDPYNPPPLPYNPPNNGPGNEGPSKNDPDGDTDGDGLTNAEEDEIGTNPSSKYTDKDAVEDGKDAWPTIKEFSFPRRGSRSYAVIALGTEKCVDLNNNGVVLRKNGATFQNGVWGDPITWTPSTTTYVASQINDQGAIVGTVTTNVTLPVKDENDAIQSASYSCTVATSGSSTLQQTYDADEIREIVPPYRNGQPGTQTNPIFLNSGNSINNSGLAGGLSYFSMTGVPGRPPTYAAGTFLSGAFTRVVSNAGLEPSSWESAFVNDAGTTLADFMVFFSDGFGKEFSTSTYWNLDLSNNDWVTCYTAESFKAWSRSTDFVDLTEAIGSANHSLHSPNERLEMIGEAQGQPVVLINGRVFQLSSLLAENNTITNLIDLNDHGLILAEGTKINGVTSGTAVPCLLIPMEIMVPDLKKNQDGSESFDYEASGSLRLKSAAKLAIGTLENSFEATSQRPLKPNWIEDDPDHFYVRVTDPGQSGDGPIKVRVWTDSEGTDYDDDDRSSADSEVVELYEEGSSGVFKSKAMLLVSNDGDDDHIIDGVPDDGKNDRTRKIALGGKVKAEFLGYKQEPTFKADLTAEVPIEKIVKIKVFVAKTAVLGTPKVVVTDAVVEHDIKVMQETFAQAGVKIAPNATIVNFNDSEAGISLGVNGLTATSVTPSAEGTALFDWIDSSGQRAADEIGVVYVNFLSAGTLYGDSGQAAVSYIAKLNSTAKYANYFVISARQRSKYTASHESLHILLNAQHPDGPNDYPAEFSNRRMTWSGPTGGSETNGIEGRKRISKRTGGRQVFEIRKSPYAK